MARAGGRSERSERCAATGRHHIALIEKLDQPDLRLWYAATALEHGWSRDVLVSQIAAQLHQRAGKAITNFATTIPPIDSDLAQQSTKDPYLFDFLSATDLHREREIEQALVVIVTKWGTLAVRAGSQPGVTGASIRRQRWGSRA